MAGTDKATIQDYLDPAGCPLEAPPRAAMGAATRALHDAIDAHARRVGVAYLHPEEPTVQLDLLGSPRVIAWQEGKAERLWLGEAPWSELPHLYARYGTTEGGRLCAALRELWGARAALAVDSGMQAAALTFDVLIGPGDHAIALRQVYNKSRGYLERLTQRVGGSLSVVDDGDREGLAAALRPNTALLFAETYTNPLTRAQDPAGLVAFARAARARAPGLRLVVDDTIATPWGLRRPLLEHGVDVVISAGTKALGGQDRDLFGVIVTRDVDLANQLMDLLAMRGGLLDGRRARAILEGLPAARTAFERRCAAASRVAAFLADHPRVEAIWHPSLPGHPDAAVIDEHYALPGSLVSLRVRGVDEAGARHVADVIAMTEAIRYALSFDGLVTKVNHHATVSEFFTPPEALQRAGLDRLIRLAVGLEEPEDLIAALNWALHHADRVSPAALAAWRSQRAAALGIGP